MITAIGAQHYRCFANLDVSLGPYSVLAGANGSGKSTLLDIPVLLGDLLQRGITDAFLLARPEHGPRAQALAEIFHRGQGRDLTLQVTAQLPQAVLDSLLAAAPAKVKGNPTLRPTRIRYELGLSLTAQHDLLVRHELLDLLPAGAPPGGARPADPSALGWRPIIERQPERPLLIRSEFRRGQFPLDDAPPHQLVLAQVADQLLFPAATWLSRFLRQEALSYQPDCQLLRKPAPPGMSAGAQPNAANLPWLVAQLRKQVPERFAEWVRVVRVALPTLYDIQAIEREEDHFAYLKLSYKSEQSAAGEADHSVTSSGLSDGTLRILAFTILPYLDQLPAVLMVEQPEDGIHPRAISIVLDALSSLPATQVLVSTHSPVVIAQTELAQIICTRRDPDGATEAVNGPAHPHLQDWRNDISLGALFAAGVLS